MCTLVLLWLSPCAWASEPVPVTRLPDIGQIQLEPYSQILLDPEGRYSVDEVAFSDLAQSFAALDKPLSFGFTPAAVWLRLNLSSPKTQEWWLQIEQPILENVTVFERDPGGFWRRYSNALSETAALPGLDTRKPTFALQLSPDEPRLVLIRLQTRTAMVSGISLWQPQKLTAKTSSESFVWGMVIGAYALVIVFYTLFSIWTKKSVYTLYSALIFINFASAMLTDKWNYDLGLNLSPGAQITILGLFVSLAPTASFAFQNAYARTYDHWPRFTQSVLVTSMAVSFVGALLALTGQYRLSALLVQSFSVVMVAINTVLLSWLSLLRNRKAQLLLLAFSIFHLSVGWRYMRNMGYVEPSYLNEHAYQIGAFVHMLILSTGIFSGYNRLRQESERQQAKAIAEAQLREQQSQFLGMVAHEVKTPLAVITASADNLQLTAGMPASALQRVEKISRNSTKIQNIFQSYLDNEQVLNSNKPFHFKELDLSGLVHSLAQDFQDTHGTTIFLTTEPNLKVHADRQLLSIAINNLLDNAHKYAPPDSVITVSVTSHHRQASITVTDNGPGIDEDDLPNIFNAYYRGSNSARQSGSGLGLHLVRYIAEQHKGTATAIRKDNGGMNFVIMLPHQSA
jgi:signal transduction histidine kinase